MAIWFRSYLRRIDVRGKTIQRVTQSILEHAGHPTAQLSLSFVGKTRMRSLNRHYRERDYPTDVLAFPMESLGAPGPLSGRCRHLPSSRYRASVKIWQHPGPGNSSIDHSWYPAFAGL